MNFNQTWFLKFVPIVLPMSITCLAIARHSSKFSFIPNHYDIQIRPILDPGEDAGSQNTAPAIVKIIGVTRNKTNLLRFYSYGLEVDPNSIKINCLISINGIEGSLNVSNVSKVNNDKELVIQLRNEAAEGDELEVYMEYLITIGNWGGNLVYSKCQSEECQNSIIVGTRFQMEHKYVSYTWIWRAFPSVENINIPKSEDSGSFKATFSLTIIRKDAQKSVSNAEIISSTPDPNHEGWVLDKYSETEKISPDMLSFVVFSNYSTLTIESTNVTIRVHAASSYLQNGRALFAAEIGTTLMNFLEEYLNASISSYGKMKLDFVIPSVWIPLASWKVCYFSPNSPTRTILVDEKNTTRSRIVVANNIVTCVVENWAYQAGENCLSAGIKLYLKQLAMERLSTLTNTPTDTVTYFEEFRQAFYITNVDSLRPYKSWGIMRMLKGFLNRLSSQSFLQSYFHLANENDEGITDEILIDRMKEVLPLIGDAFPSWCGNVGYPLIKIGKLNESHIILSQEPFKLDDDNNDSMKNITWNIPISVNINGYEKYWGNLYWLNSKTHLVAQKITSSVILLNPRGTGYYRVLYDEELYHLLKKQLIENAKLFHQEGRAQLLEDAFAFARSGYISIQTTLNLTQYLENEKEIVVWETVLQHLEPIRHRLSSHPSGYKSFMTHIHKQKE
ncbi:unnamed protein product [Orchesella dallaii]|uniref:ERAP1-like C-terminal domain-containing protein n=1 Tax=Orchesella dallaii TaxID=48710 RepID=A0ABP1RGJ8_9HEXA